MVVEAFVVVVVVVAFVVVEVVVVVVVMMITLGTEHNKSKKEGLIEYFNF